MLPHEETHPKAKADRLELMRATQANPEPIYGLYEDPRARRRQRLAAVTRRSEPLLYATFPGTYGPEASSTCSIGTPIGCLLADLEEFFGPRRVWIADGHHRYETALNYQKERREAGRTSRHPARSL